MTLSIKHSALRVPLLSVTMKSAVMLSAVMLNVIMLNVVAPVQRLTRSTRHQRNLEKKRKKKLGESVKKNILDNVCQIDSRKGTKIHFFHNFFFKKMLQQIFFFGKQNDIILSFCHFSVARSSRISTGQTFTAVI